MTKYEILNDQGQVINTINASIDFVLTHYPGRFRRAAETAAEKASVIDALVLDYDAKVQSYMDAFARSWGYGEKNKPEMSALLHAISYAEEPAVPLFQAEGRALRAWRSLVWEACYAMLAEVRTGQRTVPTIDEVIAALPMPPAREAI